MTDLTPTPILSPVPQLETNTLALGGTGNPMNFQAQALLNRVTFVREEAANNLQDYTEALASELGSTMIGFKRVPLYGAINTASKMLSTTAISINEYEHLVVDKPNPADPSTWDWDPAINAIAALNTASGPAPDGKGIAVLLPLGTWKWRSVGFNARTEIFGAGATVMPFDPTQVSTHLLLLTAHSRMHNVTFDMDYSMTYDAAVWVRGRHVQQTGCVIWKARTGWVFGNPAWATNPAQGMLGDSENMLISCESIWCITPVKAYGQNTILTFTSCLLYTFKESLPPGDPRKAAWEALPATTMYNWGGLIYVVGGGLANFSGAAPLLRSELQPVTGDPAYSNAFGKYFLEGVHIETGWLFECGPVGAYTADDTQSRMLRVGTCNGYMSTSPAPFISVGGSAQQSVSVTDNNFYGQINNNIVYSLASKTHIDRGSFRSTSIDIMQAIHALRLEGYENLSALSAYGSAQAFTGTPADLAMPTMRSTDIWDSFQVNWYNTASGAFTPQVNMRSVAVNVGLRLTAGTVTDTTDFQLWIGGSMFQTLRAIGSNPAVTFKVPRVSAGQVFLVKVAQNQSRTADGSTSNFLEITGNV